MKLTVLGGGGVRSPLLARSILRRAEALGLREVVFMDNDAEKLRLYGGIAGQLAVRIAPETRFSVTTDLEEAVRDAAFVITTLRVGAEEGRVADERIALDRGVLGQETTGAGGFAMAMRSIPALLEGMRAIQRWAKPEVMVFNFTNPSGLVTQALRDAGHQNVYGVCDGPSEFIKELERLLGAGPGEFSTECFGLNHLSWFRNARFRGRDVTQELIRNPELYRATEMRVFDPDLAGQLGVLLNGYLYYFYNREQAIANILKAPKTRGESILEINGQMRRALSSLDMERDFAQALDVYLHYHNLREQCYMSIETGGAKTGKQPLEADALLYGADDGGYAGVALKFIACVTRGAEDSMVLLAPNRGAIHGLEDDDVVEVTCRISRAGAVPIPIGAVDPLLMNLISQVKLYERLSVAAIREKSVQKARLALMTHPLVNSYTLARALVDEYVRAHRPYIGEWQGV